ncbi:MAG: type 4a pilus biogenesis protein PilO [Candidatus Portnoybacteria bacterium]
MNKIVVSLSSLVIGLVLIFLFIDPLWSSVAALKERMESKSEEIVRIESLISKKQELEKKYQEVSEEAEKAFLALPKEEDLPYLISQFDTMALKNGLLLETVRFVKPEKSENKSDQPQTIVPGFSNLAAAVKLSGSYEAFKGYLRDIENGLRMMEVVSIGLNSQRGILNLDLFNFDLNVNVYYQ